MSRARDNADKLSGGEVIKIDNLGEGVTCFDEFYNFEPIGLNIKNSEGDCTFSIDENGKINQNYKPRGDLTPQGVILVSSTGGLRVLADGKLSITKDGGESWYECFDINAEPPEIPPAELPLPPNVDPPEIPSPDVIIGEDENANPISEYDELKGFFHGTLYMPTRESPIKIVYPAGGTEVIYPACAGKEIDLAQEFLECKSSIESLSPNIIISQRLPVVDDLPNQTVEMKTSGTNDELGNYDFSISTYPGNLDSDCSKKSADAATFYFYEGSCEIPIEELGDGKVKMYYANFRPAGINAYKCGNGLICSMYVNGWKTPGPWGGSYIIDKWAQKEDDSFISLEDEMNGLTTQDVYYPSKSNPQLIIYEGSIDIPIVYPGCAGIPSGQLGDCASSESSLTSRAIIAHRVRPAQKVDGSLTKVQYRHTDTGSDLLAWDFAVSHTPTIEGFENFNPNCGFIYNDNIPPQEGATFYFSYPTLPESECSVDQTKPTLYAMFRPAIDSSDPDECGQLDVNGLIYNCRLEVLVE